METTFGRTVETRLLSPNRNDTNIYRHNKINDSAFDLNSQPKQSLINIETQRQSNRHNYSSIDRVNRINNNVCSSSLYGYNNNKLIESNKSHNRCLDSTKFEVTTNSNNYKILNQITNQHLVNRVFKFDKHFSQEPNDTSLNSNNFFSYDISNNIDLIKTNQNYNKLTSSSILGRKNFININTTTNGYSSDSECSRKFKRYNNKLNISNKNTPDLINNNRQQFDQINYSNNLANNNEIFSERPSTFENFFRNKNENNYTKNEYVINSYGKHGLDESSNYFDLNNQDDRTNQVNDSCVSMRSGIGFDESFYLNNHCLNEKLKLNRFRSIEREQSKFSKQKYINQNDQQFYSSRINPFRQNQTECKINNSCTFNKNEKKFNNPIIQSNAFNTPFRQNEINSAGLAHLLSPVLKAKLNRENFNLKYEKENLIRKSKLKLSQMNSKQQNESFSFKLIKDSPIHQNKFYNEDSFDKENSTNDLNANLTNFNLTWKNFNCNPTIQTKEQQKIKENIQNRKNHINLEQEISLLKLNFKNNYVSNKYSIVSETNKNNEQPIHQLANCLKENSKTSLLENANNTAKTYSSASTNLVYLKLPGKLIDQQRNENSIVKSCKNNETQVCDEPTTSVLEPQDITKQYFKQNPNNTLRSESIPSKPKSLDLYDSFNSSKRSNIEVVPLENALQNMNEILKNLTSNVQKKTNELAESETIEKDIDSVDNEDFSINSFLLEEKLKDLSPPLSTSTSISLLPPSSLSTQDSSSSTQHDLVVQASIIPQFSNTNIVNLSPSASSSSSYSNSSNSSSSSSENCESVSHNSTGIIQNLSNTTFPDQNQLLNKNNSDKNFIASNTIKQTLTDKEKIKAIKNQDVINQQNENSHKSLFYYREEKKCESMSLSKRLRRFLSLNSGSSKRHREVDFAERN